MKPLRDADEVQRRTGVVTYAKVGRTHGAESVGVKVSHAGEDKGGAALDKQFLGSRNPCRRNCGKKEKETIIEGKHRLKGLLFGKERGERINKVE